MTALFVPALRIMGAHFPECAELSQHRSSAERGKKGVQPYAALSACPAVPCKRSPCARAKNSSDKIAALWGLESL